MREREWQLVENREEREERREGTLANCLRSELKNIIQSQSLEMYQMKVYLSCTGSNSCILVYFYFIVFPMQTFISDITQS